MHGPRRTALVASRLAAAASRLARRNGTSLPGKVLLRLDPGALTSLTGPLDRVALISATNGKTTTAACVRAIMAAAGRPTVGNAEGANMAGGIAASLANQRPTIARGDAAGVLEVDEFWLPQLAHATAPDAILLGNLFRDQLDRYGELDAIASRWRELLPQLPRTTAVLCADDPLVASTASPDGRTVWFGIDDPGIGTHAHDHAADAIHCFRCGTPLDYARVFAGHTGHWTCPGCGNARPQPQVTATDVRAEGSRGTSFTLSAPGGSVVVSCPLPGLYNVANAVGAAALGLELGASLDDCRKGLAVVDAAFGRGERVQLGDRELLLMLIKNPVGANEVMRTIAQEPGPVDLLAVLNDRIADGRDVSWVWDADVEAAAPHVRSIICSGTRAAEMAMRWHYAGVPPERITVEPVVERALDAVVEGTGPLVVLPTYTAMLELRRLMAARGAVEGAFA